MSTGSVSSSLSTGGAGTFFERDVAAYWFSQLLLRAIPPILIDTQVTEVSFQTEHLGWKTDDLLITCEGAGAVRRKLAGQVKRETLVGAWRSLVAHLHGVQGVPSSNLGAPTIK